MGILSKMRERKMAKKEDAIVEKSKKSEKTQKVEKKETAAELPELKEPKKWLDEVKKMAKEGVDEIDESYDTIVGKNRDISEFVLNLGVIAANYLSFRSDVYYKLSEYYGDSRKAIKEVDKALKSIDEEFIDRLIGVIRRWILEGT